eukprot:GFUD01005766.1.p1 GENE.GFUD01005766.1~~GFUD01005766.1.p1  ORF type:complete len:592 (-),score=147.56 GFUD01005766.1:293-2068(-)
MVNEVRAEKGEAPAPGALDNKEETEADAKNGAIDKNGNENQNVEAEEKPEEVKENGAIDKNGNENQNVEAEEKPEEVKENTYTNLEVCFLCAKPATETCDKCNLVGFCSEDHKTLHRPENFCFPFMVEQKQDVGRFVVAVRDIEPLELVMWDNAAALGPRMGCPPVCLQCLKPVNGSFSCEKCNWPVCDKKCADGSAHRIECETLKNAKEKVEFTNFQDPHDMYRCIAPLRLLKVKEKVPEVWERLTYLMDHNTERRGDTELWDTYQTSVNRFLKSSDPSFKDEDIDRAVGLLWTNAFACSNGGGQAIFPTFSFMSHSCAPNCAHSVFPNKTLALQAKVKINAGEEFTISYISTLQGSLKRRMKLHDKWYFDCKCARCMDPTELGSFTSAHLCQVCLCPEAFVLTTEVENDSAPWKCVKCGLLTPASDLNAKETQIAMEMQKVDNNSLVGFEEFHEKTSTILHPGHYLNILLKRHLVGLYSGVLTQLEPEDLERVKKYCEEVDAVYQKIDPGYQKERGTILRALCETSKLLAKKYLNDQTETEDQFSVRVKKCIELFQESQKCMFVRLKKDPNDVSKYLVVARKDPIALSS